MSRHRLFLPILVLALATCKSDDSTGPQVNTCTGTCIVVENASSLTITTVNFSNCSDDLWGANRLGGGTLGPGGSRGWSVSPGCWDVRALATQGSTTYGTSHFGVDLSSGETFTLVFEVTPP